MLYTQARSSRLQAAALTPIGDEGRTEMVESRLARSISAGAFADGDRLPTENELARLLGVAVVTVREALISLRARGLIVTRRGRHGGSFVRTSLKATELHNAQNLLAMPRVTLADLGLHYEMISASCAELACLRATEFELSVIQEILTDARNLPQEAWRRRITDVQLELASLSQSVSLTSEHLRVQTVYTPLLALQDADEEARAATHAGVEAQVKSTLEGNIEHTRQLVRAEIRASTRWLIIFREKLLKNPTEEHILHTLKRRGSTYASGAKDGQE